VPGDGVECDTYLADEHGIHVLWAYAVESDVT
jgi:hypothetical protein